MHRKIEILRSNWFNSFSGDTFREFVIRESEEDRLFFSWLFDEEGLSCNNLSPIQEAQFNSIIESITY